MKPTMARAALLSVASPSQATRIDGAMMVTATMFFFHLRRLLRPPRCGHNLSVFLFFHAMPINAACQHSGGGAGADDEGTSEEQVEVMQFKLS
jgi:hypothetical protein